MKKITVLHKRIGEAPEAVSVENTLEGMQKLVGGSIQVINIIGDVTLIVNEEGKLQELGNNFSIHATAVFDNKYSDKLLDIIKGNAFFASRLGENFHSLDKQQMQELKKQFKHNNTALIFDLK